MSDHALNQIIADDLSYLRSVAESGGLDAESSASLLGEVEALARKSNSGELQLSVFGEFNTGKSTFINALLGQDILTAARRPTTQVCVHIRYGSDLKITASMPDGSVRSIPLEEVSEVVSEQGSLKHALRVDISVPSERLRNGLVIIDTPGINVDIERHIRITDEALAGSNACIFMMKATMPGAKTSIDYLKRISASVDKLFLVLNMCDLVDDDELAEAVEYLQTVLNDECGISTPRIHAISSLRNIEETSGASGDGFAEFSEHLSWFMQTDKQVVLARGLAKLQDAVIAKASALVSGHRRRFEDELQQRYEHAMPDSEAFAVEQLNRLNDEIAEAIGAVAAELESYTATRLAQLQNQAEQRISNATNKREFKKRVPEDLQSYFSSCAHSIVNLANQELGTLFSRTIESIDLAYSGLFGNVQSIIRKLFFRDPMLYVLALSLSGLATVIGWYESLSLGFIALLAAGGALLGLGIFALIFENRVDQVGRIQPAVPADMDAYITTKVSVSYAEMYPFAFGDGIPAGARAVLGNVAMAHPLLGAAAAAGALLLDWLCGPKLDEVKAEVRGRVEEQYSELSEEMVRYASSSVEKYKEYLPLYCEQRVEQMDARYGQVIVELARRGREGIADIEARVQTLSEIELELSQRSQRIAQALVDTRQLLVPPS